MVGPPCGGSQDSSRGKNSQCAGLSKLQSEFSLAADYSEQQSELKTGSMPPKPKKRPAEVPVTPPTRKQLRRQQELTGSNPTDTSSLTLPQLKAVPAEVLRHYLSSCNLITTGNVAATMSRLHSALHQQQSDPLPSTSVTSQTAAPPLTQLQQSV